ncbi:MAG: S9 family peptidase, partial [Acidimicrobiales bacterium]|nr:S9 family peptidase [Acidimicrobiales bacterium]
DESIVQPGFLADGTLVWCSDRSGWWNPWCLRPGAAEPEPMLDGEPEVEIGGPLWVGGLRWWTELSPGRLLVVARSEGQDRLALVEPDRTLRVLDTPFTEISQVVAVGDGRTAAVVAGTPTAEPLPILVTVDDDGTVDHEVLRPVPEALDPAWISVPEPIAFASDDGGEAHGLVYPPTNPEAEAPAGERPPLVVMIHGGPTSHARHVFSLAKQYWTSRGFAVVDVDHGGSTGYGRPFRRRLDGRWGELDVADAAAAARHLADEGRADPERLLIRGGSAGGFTTLAALCFGDTFAAGASHYGIADLGALAAETHKFESRYLDGLVGSWPEARATYEARSPILHVAGFDRPLIVLQGADDLVVPPDQAEMIVAALAAKGVPHAYVLFEGEGHGFRGADAIVRALEAELWFYGRVLGFEPADDIEPVEGAVGLG